MPCSGAREGPPGAVSVATVSPVAFTVVIPAYNPDPALLGRAIESAWVVAGVDRVIVIDDGSAEPVRVDDERTTLVRQDNAGPSRARNHGLDVACQGGGEAPDGVIFLDADDELLAPGMEHLLALIERTGAGAGLPARIERSRDGGELLKEIPAEWRDGTLSTPHDTWRPTVLFSTSGLVLMRPVLETGLRFDETICVVEDRELMHRAALVAPFAMGAQPGVMMTKHEAGSNLTSAAHFPTRVRGHVAIMDRYFTPDVPESARKDWRDATRWLINAVAKAPVDDETWRLLVDAAKRTGCPVPIKARVRRATRGILSSR